MNRRCIHGRTERQVCAKCNAEDSQGDAKGITALLARLLIESKITINDAREIGAEFATLRAALDGLVVAAQMAVPALAYGAPVQAAAGLGDPEPAFRAALATAKETP